MLLRAIIIDDEQKGINTLKILIENHLVALKIVAESTRAINGIELIENYRPEIVFLDINMPDLNGFELLEKLNWRNFHLVFTTAHQEYAIQALKINAIDYLLKPIDPKDLLFAVNKIKDKIASNKIGLPESDYKMLLNSLDKNKKILINSKTGAESVNILDIVCLEAMSNYTQIHLKDSRKIITSKTLKEFDTQLCVSGQHFMRVHNSFIINLQQVSKYIKEKEVIVMSAEQKIPLAKSRRDVFFEWMGV